MKRYAILVILVLLPSVVGFPVQSVAAMQGALNANATLVAYFKALRAQDANELEKLSIVEEAPFLLGYDVIHLGEASVDQVDLQGLRATYDGLIARQHEVDAQAEALEKEHGPVREEVNRIAKKTQDLLGRFQKGEITSGDYAREVKALGTERETIESARAIHARRRQDLDQEQSQLLESQLAVLRTLVRHSELLRKGLGLDDNAVERINSFNVQTRHAVADLQIQSVAGFKLHKKHRITLQRPLVPGRSGRWIVTELDDLSE